MTQPITPTQADREAAAKWAKSNSRHAQAANIRRGSCDTAPLVQAFARHAAAAREEGYRAGIEAAAKVADEAADRANAAFGAGAGGVDGKDRNAARYRTAIGIAISIRALASERGRG